MKLSTSCDSHGRLPSLYLSAPLILLTLFLFGGGVSCELAALAWVDPTCCGEPLQDTPISKGISTSLAKDQDVIMHQ